MTARQEIASLGVIGTGHLSGFVCEGLRNAGWIGDLIVSSHNPIKAADFQQRFGAQTVECNQNVISTSEAVFVAVRPGQVSHALAGLEWAQGQLLISAMAGVKLATLQALAVDATVVRTMPVSSAALGASPTSCFPENNQVTTLLCQVGSVTCLSSEDEFEAASVNGAAYGWYFALIDEMTRANERAGVSTAKAKMIAVETLASAAKVASHSEQSGGEILTALATPGGITAKGQNFLNDQNAIAPWGQAFDLIADGLKGDKRD
jgi:pyrroline-5-carboxylate reductase